jgi:Biopolymer transport protein
MNFRKTGKNRTPDINLTPLVDVVLLLVLFFMATAQFSIMPGLKLVLPALDSKSQVKVEAGERLEISLTASGDVYFEDQLSSLANLPLHLGRTGTGGNEVVVVVSADEAVPYGRIMKVMDTLRQAGFNRVVFAARVAPAEKDKD